ncbi:hypothetical protein [Microbacterium aurantiacum]|uniref:hypothetical protein n=1 Tax=Microbacterium aurantiacum TaxID=162393 RepID=UPI001AD5FFFC|nr:hypothetical protein [Microbacterium chocolatum]
MTGTSVQTPLATQAAVTELNAVAAVALQLEKEYPPDRLVFVPKPEKLDVKFPPDVAWVCVV